MADKGGKGFSLPKGGKSSLKTPSSLKGKDDSSAKLKRGQKVRFDSEESLESKINASSKACGKFDTPVAKGDWGKGGKGDKVANGGKSPSAKEHSKLELKVDTEMIRINFFVYNCGRDEDKNIEFCPVRTNWRHPELELPKNAKCLMDCEAADILQGIQEHMVILSEDPTIKIPIAFDRGLQYAKSGSHYTSPQFVRQVLEPLKSHGVSDGEMCVIANICPESDSEVFALIPSLKGKKSKLMEPLKDALSKLAKLKQST